MEESDLSDDDEEKSSWVSMQGGANQFVVKRNKFTGSVIINDDVEDQDIAHYAPVRVADEECEVQER